MRRTSIIAAAIGSSLVVSSSFAAFTLSVVPSAQPATAAGYSAYDLFALNDADTSDGVNLQGVAFTITAGGSTKIRIAGFDDGSGNLLNDQWNYGSGTQANTIVDVNASNLRIGTRASGQHAFTDYTGDGTPFLTAEEVANGLSVYTADYAVLSAAVSFPANTAPGARFARLVVSGASPAFTIVGAFGGEAGTAQSASTSFGDTPPGNDPVINSITPNPVNVVFGSIVSNGAPFSTTVNATDADGELVVLTLSSDPNVSNLTITPGANGDFVVSGLVNYAANGTTISLTATATDPGGRTDTDTISLVVTPEPASLSLLGLGGLLLGRRRK